MQKVYPSLSVRTPLAPSTKVYVAFTTDSKATWHHAMAPREGGVHHRVEHVCGQKTPLGESRTPTLRPLTTRALKNSYFFTGRVGSPRAIARYRTCPHWTGGGTTILHDTQTTSAGTTLTKLATHTKRGPQPPAVSAHAARAYPSASPAHFSHPDLPRIHSLPGPHPHAASSCHQLVPPPPSQHQLPHFY